MTGDYAGTANEPTDLAANITRGPGYAAEYGRNIRGAVRALWSGVLDYDQFYNMMIATVRFGLPRNWNAGAAECGIKPSELSPAEQNALQEAIFSEINRISDFANAIEAGSKANGGKQGVQLARASLWSARALDIQNRAKLMACADKKLKWVRGPTSDSCRTCIAMDGKVKRGSYWTEHGPHPQDPPNETIMCHGWNCLCNMEPTDEPLSRGPLPRWP